MTHRLRFLAVATSLLVLAASNRALAQSYGPGDQVLTISAADFHPSSSVGAFSQEYTGYLYGPGAYLASINLPDGAQITQICLDAYSLNPGDVDFLAQTHGVSMTPGEDPTIDYWAQAATDFNYGFGSVCTTPLAHTIRSVFDPGNGLRSYRHRILATIWTATGELAGVRISWHRQVSPAPAAATFGDVPASDGAFQFIEALVAAGVTSGCGGGNYCPDAPLTRRQMAVFLSKALGLHWSVHASCSRVCTSEANDVATVRQGHHPAAGTAVARPASRARRSMLAPGIQSISTLAGLAFEGGEGALLVDVDGNRFIDFVAGICVASLGHGHPALAAALARAGRASIAAGSFTSEARASSCSSASPRRPRRSARAAHAHAALLGRRRGGGERAAPGARLHQEATRSSPSGAASTARPAACSALMGSDFKHGLGPLVPGQHLAPYPDCYRCPFDPPEHAARMRDSSQLISTDHGLAGRDHRRADPGHRRQRHPARPTGCRRARSPRTRARRAAHRRRDDHRLGSHRPHVRRSSTTTSRPTS